MVPQIHRLPSALVDHISASAFVPSFSAAAAQLVQYAVLCGASCVSVTTEPAALRLTVVHDGPVVGDPGTFAALSAVAAVEVVWRTGGVVRSRACRAGKPLDAVEGHSSALALLPPGTGDATVVDVWELFHNLPVRRRAAFAMDSDEILEEVRAVIARIVLANPSVDVQVHSLNRASVLRSVPSKEICRSSIAPILGTAIVDDLIPVMHPIEPCAANMPLLKPKAQLSLQGFISKSAVSCCTESQFVSLNSFPLSQSSLLHRIFRQSCRRHSSCRRDPSDTASYLYKARVPSSQRLRPAFVVNFAANDSIFDWLSSEKGLDVQFHDIDTIVSIIDCSIARSLLRSSTTGPSEAMSGNARSLFRNYSAPVCSSRRKRPLSAPQRQSKCMPLAKKSRSAGYNLSISDAIADAVKECIPQLMPSFQTSCRTPCCSDARQDVRLSCSNAAPRAQSCARRPSSAAEVSQGILNVAPSWSNPCYPSRGTRSATTINSRKIRLFQHDGDMALDVRKVVIPREEICRLRVIGQADRKFILLVDSAQVVFAMDQHAASERLRFESLCRKLTESVAPTQSVPVASKTVIMLSPKQASLVRIHEDCLRYWGWCLTKDKATPEICRYEMVAVPVLSLVDIVLRDPHHLLSYLDSIVDGASPKAVPRPFLDTLATSACHSAVRFGDSLSRRECNELIQALAKCDTPFICAHGRPSIAPLVIL